jgi:hypothetical protein
MQTYRTSLLSACLLVLLVFFLSSCGGSRGNAGENTSENTGQKTAGTTPFLKALEGVPAFGTLKELVETSSKNYQSGKSSAVQIQKNNAINDKNFGTCFANSLTENAFAVLGKFIDSDKVFVTCEVGSFNSSGVGLAVFELDGSIPDKKGEGISVTSFDIDMTAQRGSTTFSKCEGYDITLTEQATLDDGTNNESKVIYKYDKSSGRFIEQR